MPLAPLQKNHPLLQYCRAHLVVVLSKRESPYFLNPWQKPDGRGESGRHQLQFILINRQAGGLSPIPTIYLGILHDEGICKIYTIYLPTVYDAFFIYTITNVGYSRQVLLLWAYYISYKLNLLGFCQWQLGRVGCSPHSLYFRPPLFIPPPFFCPGWS